MDGVNMTNKEFNDRVKKAQERYEKLQQNGWEETPNGLLSIEEIKNAGFVRQDGKWKIPTDVYIAEVAHGGLSKGAKYIGISMKYINWLEEKKRSKESGQTKIDVEILEQEKLSTKDANNIEALAKEFGGTVVSNKIDIENIPF